MSDSVKIEILGLTKALAALQILNSNVLKNAVKHWMELTMDPIRRATPVDIGTLRGSLGNDIAQEGGIITVTFFAGGPAAPYALAVHEHPSQFSPKSWKGKTIKWNARGTGPKYIENPARERLKSMDAELAAEINAELQKILR